MSFKTVSVLGLGHWGTALGHHLASKGFPVLGWSVETEVVAGINSAHRNPKYLSQIELHKELRATLKLDEVMDADLCLLVLPASALAQVVPQLKLSKKACLVSAVKGFEPESQLTPLQLVRQELGDELRSVVISGPTFASDVAAGKPCGLVAASKHAESARAVAEVLTTRTMKAYTSTDPLGVELGGIVKNVIAIAVGMVDGLNLGDSARAGLITRGLAEMIRLAQALGAELQTLAGLSGLGDLVMTATCDTSRNRTVGVRLGRGEKLSAIVQSLGSVAEGVTATPVVLDLARRYGVEMPIAECVGRILNGSLTPKEMVQELVARPLKSEY